MPIYKNYDSLKINDSNFNKLNYKFNSKVIQINKINKMNNVKTVRIVKKKIVY